MPSSSTTDTNSKLALIVLPLAEYTTGITLNIPCLSPEKLTGYLEDFTGYQPVFDLFPNYSPAQLSLRFCISHPACQTAIPGAKTPDQVKANCSSSDIGPIP